MKRALLIAAAGIAALAFALPATAGTVSFRGVVVAKDSARKSIVTVSRNGVVRTIRARGLKRVRVGRLVAVQAASLPDGTFAASKVRPLGPAGASSRSASGEARPALLPVTASVPATASKRTPSSRTGHSRPGARR